MLAQWSPTLPPNVFLSVTTSTTMASTATSILTGGLTPRQVGPPILLSGEILSITKNPYSVEVLLKVASANGTFKGGDPVDIRFSGIGSVSSWRVYQYLKVGDRIRVVVRFVENLYWEAYDSDWSLVAP